MVPAPPTEDFYAVLGVSPNATFEAIVQSYRRLALKLHPDRNPRPDATQAFQLLGRAYETLQDEGKRREYDRIYPTIRKQHASKESKQKAQPSPTSTSQAQELSEAAQIAVLNKSKQERTERWHTKKKEFEAVIAQIKAQLDQLTKEIGRLDLIASAEAAAESKKNSWGAWLFSPIFKNKEDSVEEKARKDIEKQERRMEKDMKERRMALRKADLEVQEDQLRKAKEDADAAIRVDERKIQAIEDRIKAREYRARQEKERVEQQRRAEFYKQYQAGQEKRNKEAAKAKEKEQAARRAAEEKRNREWQASLEKQRAEQENEDKISRAEQEKQRRAAESKRQAAAHSSCLHGGWWDKVLGRAPCPECQDVWNYLLECPTCPKQACPKCQSIIRPRYRG